MAAVTKMTPKRKAAFLKALACTGNVGDAARAARVNRTQTYAWRAQDLDFAAKWDDTIEHLIDAAEAELYRRGVEGYLKPVFQGGELVGEVQEFSDACLIFLLKCNRSKYHPVQKTALTDPSGEGPCTIRVVYETEQKPSEDASSGS